MHAQTHTAADLLNGPTFHDFDHVIDIEGQAHKITAVHGGDTSTAHYWNGRSADDILLSVRPCVVNAHGAHCTGAQIKHMVSPDQPLTAFPVAA